MNPRLSTAEMQERLATVVGLLDEVHNEVRLRADDYAQWHDAEDPAGCAPAHPALRAARRQMREAVNAVAALSDVVDDLGDP